MKPDVSIVFPAYNEAGNIAVVLEEFATALSEVNAEFIVVNDGSSDDTQVILNAIDMSNLQVVEHETNKGYGAALCSGFGAANGRWTFFTDADRQFNPSDFFRLWNRRMEADLILGVRSNRNDPPFRKLNALLWGYYVRKVFSVQVKDLNCAFKLLPTSPLQEFSLHSKGAFINAEMLALFYEAQCKWIEVPVEHHPRTKGTQTGAHPKVIVKAFQESIQFWVRKHVG